MLTELEPKPFLDERYKSTKDAYKNAFNPDYWRHGITISQGNELNVSEKSAQERLIFIRARLLRKTFGNHFRQKKASVDFCVFKHGSKLCFDEHFHALMGIQGNHDWSDAQIAEAIQSIDLDRPHSKRWEKPLHVDYDWEDGNQFHSYVSRFVQNGSDDFFII
jgi:hypothetical protein